ncbi:MAG: lipid-binding SYLF domain-containing protein [Acidobacteriota bacterium]
MNRHRFIASLSILLALVITAAAQNSNAKEVSAAAKTARNATRSLDEIMSIRDKSIPADLLKKAKAVAVFPNVLKGAFIIGGQGGKGVISQRIGGSWGPPALFKLGGGSIGFQIGGSSTDIILLFMTDDGLTNLLEDKFEIGAEATAAAGPIGRTARATTDAQLQAAILSYSRSKGLFAGIALTGAVISPDNDANQALYNLSAKDLLTGTNRTATALIPPATKPFQQALDRYSK